jgi:AcrR family transcriptional regulator
MTKGERTRASIIAIGMQVWREQGFERVTATRVASLVGITHGAVLYHFKSTDGMRDAIAAHAVWKGDSIIVPQLIAARHPATAQMDNVERSTYLSRL